MRSLLHYRRNHFSQNGEDGIILEILRRLKIEVGWFCEFGAWDGKYGSNTYALLSKGWNGLMIEGDIARFTALRMTARKFPHTLAIEKAYVSRGGDDLSLDNLLARSSIPRDFDILSIDIDSYDYHVWQSLVKYRPKLVIIEIDSSIPPGDVSIYDGNVTTSFTAMLSLGLSKQYTLICHTGNLFFVADEYVAALGLDPELIANQNELFIWDWVEPSRLDVWRRKMRNMTWQRAITKINNMFSSY